MVKIRLQRVGTRKKVAYRVVVADSRAPRGGSFIEIIGHYDPRTEPPIIVFKQEKAAEWLKRGAQPTPTAATLLSKAGISSKLVSNAVRKPTDRKTLKKAEKKAKKEAKAAAPAAKPATTAESKPAKADAKPAAAAESKPAKAADTKPPAS